MNNRKRKTVQKEIELLFDKGSFRETDKDGCCYEGEASVITGYGKINGCRVYAYAHNPLVKGGTVGASEGIKITALIKKAVRKGCPIVGILASGGARIQEGAMALAGYGSILKEHIMALGKVPQLMVIAGTCAGGAVYAPGLSDFTFMTETGGCMFVTGPEVIHEMLGKECTKKEAGGCELHARESAAAHFISEDEQECFRQVRTLLSYLTDTPCRKRRKKMFYNGYPDALENADKEMKHIIPGNPREVYNMERVIENIADKGSLMQVRKEYGKSLITGFARLDGQRVGIVANQPMEAAGALDTKAGVKGASFVRFCDAFHIPILTFVDVPGFLPGAGQEKQGIIRHGAQLLFAYGESAVLKLTVIVRKAYGGAYICMGSRPLGAKAVYAWRNAEIAVMGAESAVSVIYGRFIKRLPEEERDVFRKKAEEEYRREYMNTEYALREGYIDKILRPENTRKQLIEDLYKYAGKGGRNNKNPYKKRGLIPL